MEEDCVKFVRHCEKCQLHADKIHAPASSLHPLSSPWPFSMWAFDVVGPLSETGSEAPKRKSFILTATEYYTKWAEAEAFAEIKATTVVKFIKINIIARFGVPKVIIMDNRPQFIFQELQGMCDKYWCRTTHGIGQAMPNSKMLSCECNAISNEL